MFERFPQRHKPLASPPTAQAFRGAGRQLRVGRQRVGGDAGRNRAIDETRCGLRAAKPLSASHTRVLEFNENV